MGGGGGRFTDVACTEEQEVNPVQRPVTGVLLGVVPRKRSVFALFCPAPSPRRPASVTHRLCAAADNATMVILAILVPPRSSSGVHLC